MSDVTPYAGATVDGFAVETNSGESSDAITENLSAPDPENDADEVSKAAAKLGSEGGKAAAEKRRAEAAAKPEAKDDAESDPGNDKPDKPLGKPDRDPKARVAQATREAKEARERAAQAEASARQAAWERDQIRQELEAARRGEAPKPKEAERDATQRPKLDDYEDYDAYVQDLTDWKVDQRFTREKAQRAVHAEASQMAQKVDTAWMSYKDRINKAVEADPEFMERVSDQVWDSLTPTWALDAHQPVTTYNVVCDELFGSEAAPGLLLYFTERPEELQRLAALRSPREISREMAKLEDRLKPATAGARHEPSVSKAKPPFRPVNGSPLAVASDGSEDEPFESHVRRENARDVKERRRAF